MLSLNIALDVWRILLKIPRKKTAPICLELTRVTVHQVNKQVKISLIFLRILPNINQRLKTKSKRGPKRKLSPEELPSHKNRPRTPSGQVITVSVGDLAKKIENLTGKQVNSQGKVTQLHLNDHDHQAGACAMECETVNKQLEVRACEALKSAYNKLFDSAKGRENKSFEPATTVRPIASRP